MLYSRSPVQPLFVRGFAVLLSVLGAASLQAKASADGAAPGTAPAPAPVLETAPEGGPIINGFQLTLIADSPRVAAGQPLMVTTRLKNTTGKKLSTLEIGADRDFEWTVKGQDGKVVPLTLFGRSTKVLWSLGWISVNPGETIEHKVLLSRLVDLSQPGNYSVCAVCVLFNIKIGPPDGTVDDTRPPISNTIQLKIVDPTMMPH